MRVLLINPPYDVERYMGKLSKMAFVFQPIGLTYIAAYLREKSIEVKIYDAQVDHRNIKDVVKEFNPHIIGITCVTALVYSAIEVAKLIKEHFSDKIIVVGGIHPTIRPQDFAEEKSIDYIALGEGEITMYEFVKEVESGGNPERISGIMRFSKGKASSGPPRLMEKNIDIFPMPALDLLEMNKYKVSPDNRTDDRVGVMLTSRGCPFDCIFCSNRLLTKKTYRAHSIERVCTEIANLIDKYQVSQVFIQDDNFAVDKKRSKEICREFIRRGINKKISWWAEARVDCVDEELLILMAEANCKIISYGLESGNQRLLDLIQKNITLAQVKTVINLTKRSGIQIRASFILGLPTETRKESLETIRFAKKLKIDQVRFAIATPFPGTKLWDIAQEEGTMKFDNWKQFSMMAGYSEGLPVYAPKGRSPEELAKLQRSANLSFYLRPRIILVFLRRINNIGAFKDTIHGFMRFLLASLFPSKHYLKRKQ